jgi:quercetin dioxygenase-like cupin family protein
LFSGRNRKQSTRRYLGDQHGYNPAPIQGIPEALHRGENELPFMQFQEGIDCQLLHADVEVGLWVIRVRFQPGVTVQRHKHTGEVFAFTIQGSWKYFEYPQVNTAGSYLYEPAGSIHTLHVPASNQEVTDVWFAIRGANLNLSEDGNIESVLDAGAVLELYNSLCKAAGRAHPDVIGAD